MGESSWSTICNRKLTMPTACYELSTDTPRHFKPCGIKACREMFDRFKDIFLETSKCTRMWYTNIYNFIIFSNKANALVVKQKVESSHPVLGNGRFHQVHKERKTQSPNLVLPGSLNREPEFSTVLSQQRLPKTERQNRAGIALP